MKYAIRNLVAAVSLAVLASCSSFNGGNGSQAIRSAPPSEAIGPARIDVSDEPVNLGASYSVGNTSYTPADAAQYDEVGYAAQYDAVFKGPRTANGEVFNPASASAAHKTLPMPSYVEVTSLDTGRTILVRINDRGPFSNDRLIDLSEGAARQLGINPKEVAAVRVRRVNPPEQEKSVLRLGMTAAERIETPEPLLKVLREKLSKQPRPTAIVARPARVDVRNPIQAENMDKTGNDRFVRENGGSQRPEKSPVSQSSVTVSDYVAQVAAFSSRPRAAALAAKLGASVAASADGRIFRVRFGPYATEAEAAAAARRKGYPEARVYRD
jgi:rare lipoprotein A